MLNLQDNEVLENNQILGSSTLSIILPTQYDTPHTSPQMKLETLYQREFQLR